MVNDKERMYNFNSKLESLSKYLHMGKYAEILFKLYIILFRIVTNYGACYLRAAHLEQPLACKHHLL